MSYAISTADQYPVKPFLLYSVLLHLGLSALMVMGVWFQRTGERWGGPGSGSGDNSVRINPVARVVIPLPQPTNATGSGVVDPTKSLHKEEQLPPRSEIKTSAIEIPRFPKKEPLPLNSPSKILPSPSGYGNTLGDSGVTVQGPGGGDFAGRYPWYVQSVVRAISQSWMQNTIDPQVRAARRAKTTINFAIYRDGSVRNIRIIQSSGNRSMDDSAQRALLSIDHFPTLPPDYSGRYVDVIFDFDLGLSR